MTNQITIEDFEKVEIRVGRIIEVQDFERARFPSYKLKIDFGADIGIKLSSARFKSDYTVDQLLNRQCLAVVNFPPRNIAGFNSEVLVLGVDKEEGGLSLVRPVHEAKLGARLH